MSLMLMDEPKNNVYCLNTHPIQFHIETCIHVDAYNSLLITLLQRPKLFHVTFGRLVQI